MSIAPPPNSDEWDWVEIVPLTMDTIPTDGNELTLRLAGWWPLNTWLLVHDRVEAMKDRES